MPEDEHVHPADRAVLRRLEHGFDLDCLPGPYCGPLKTANVVLLFLSPGLDGGDSACAKEPEGRRYYAEQRRGYASLPDAAQHRAGRDWLSRVIKQFGVDYESARTSRALATLNIGAYKSRAFPDWPMLAALPSSRVCLDWAQSVLFREAERGDRIVVCLRSHNYWGLGTGEPIGEALFRPRCNRGGFVLRDQRERAIGAVQRAVREALQSQQSLTQA